MSNQETDSARQPTDIPPPPLATPYGAPPPLATPYGAPAAPSSPAQPVPYSPPQPIAPVPPPASAPRPVPVNPQMAPYGTPLPPPPQTVPLPAPAPVASAAVAAGNGAMVRNLLIGVGSVVVIALLVVGYLVLLSSSTAERVKTAQAAHKNVVNHHIEISVRLDAVYNDIRKADANAKFDPAQVKADNDKVVAEMEAARALDTRDRGDVDTANNHVQEWGFVFFPNASALDAEQNKLDADSKALTDQLTEIDIEVKQLAIIDDYMVALVQLVPLNNDFKSGTVAAAQKDYEPLSHTLDNAVTKAADSSDTPSKMTEWLALVRSEMNDVKLLLNAIDARSGSSLNSALHNLEGDVAALNAFDGKALGDQYQQLGERLDAQVTADFKAAGITPPKPGLKV